jgi:coenzyme F420 hydrogenase subunit beta
MKTFVHLIEEVQKLGLCHHCGGCVAFCTAINYGALELGEEGRPHYKDPDKCIECGLCYCICPEISELDEEVKIKTAWQPPLGRVMDITAARSTDPEIRSRGTDGGVVTSLLMRLLELKRIDGAIVSNRVGPFQRLPWLARTKEEILEAAGFHFETSHGMKLYADIFSTFSPSVLELSHIVGGHLNRVAFVGTPCQINAMRRMQALGIIPSDSIKYYFGLFCSGNFSFGSEQRRSLEEIGNFQWEEVLKINVKEDLMIHLHNGEVRHISLDKLDFMKRYACQYCYDYSAEYADLSFGGLASPEGWTTVITRSLLGRSIMTDARGVNLERHRYIQPYSCKEHRPWAPQAMAKVQEWSEKKKQRAALRRLELEKHQATLRSLNSESKRGR